MGKKKILLNASMYTDRPAGNGIYIREVYNRLASILEQHDIEYTCYAYSSANLANTSKIKLIAGRLFANKSFSKLLGLHRLFWNFFILPIIARRYALVYSFSNHGSPFISNQVITVHDLICMQFPKQHRLQYLYNKYLLPGIIKASRSVIAISSFTKSEIVGKLNIAPNKVCVIHSGGGQAKAYTPSFSIDANNRLRQLTGGKRFFLSVGANYPHKNIERLIEAMQSLDNEYALIVTGGNSGYNKKIQKRISNYNSNIVILNYIEDDFLKYLYSHCTANVYVSLYEGFGFPPMEAAMYNKISVISNRGALPEIYAGAAFFVDPENVQQIAIAMQQAASPAFDKTAYETKQVELLKKYTWENTVKKISGLLTSVDNVALSHEYAGVE